jgi:pimeloyl-ACP methyl ester carboxylesterase
MTAGDETRLPCWDIGTGSPVVFLGGFGRGPDSYAPAIRAVAERARVVAPSVFQRSGRWNYDAVVADIAAALDARGIDDALVVGHSFGGSLAMGLAAHHPERTTAVLFVNSHALSPRWQMAADALSPRRLPGLIRREAATGVVEDLRHHPLHLARIGWWAFRTDKRTEIGQLRRAGVDAVVIFGPDDTLIPVERGRDWAEEIGAPFVFVDASAGHDWPVTHPQLFADVVLGILENGSGAACGA